MPTVTAIIPAYDAAGVLPRAIESVLGQTLADVDLVVVDDGSSDETAAVARAYDDRRVTTIVHETNRGASAARNTGLRHATGEYVAFLDADDEWLPRKLERQVAILEARSDDWVAAYCGVETAFPGGRPIRKLVTEAISRRSQTEGAEGGAPLVADVLTDDLHTSAGSTLLVRREVVEAIDGFDESFARFQDPEFLIRVLQCGNLAYVDEQLVRRYVSGDPPADAVRAADEHYLRAFADTVERLEADGHDVRGAHRYMLARHYLREGAFRDALFYLRSARRPRPRQYPGLVYAAGVGLAQHLRIRGQR